MIYLYCKDSGKMRPISSDKRKSIIDAKERKEPIGNIVKWFGVSEASVNRIYKATGTYEPIAYKGRQSGLTREIDDKILTKVREKPDITQRDLINELDLNITQSGMSRHMDKLGLTLKKRRLILVEKREKM